MMELDLPTDFLDSIGVTLCGGALFASLTNERHLTPAAFCRMGIDVDLFVTSSTVHRDVRVKRVVDHVRQSERIRKMSHTVNGFCDDFVFEYAGGDLVKVQIVSMGLLVSGADVIRSFDLSVCKLAYIGGRVQMTPDAEYCFRSKAILYVRGMSKDPRYSGRLLKYLKRLPGYKLAVDQDALAALAFAARLLDSLRLQVGLSRCNACKRAVSLALDAWTKELPPCDLGVFVSYMVQLEFPVERASQSASRPSTYAFGHRVQGDASEVHVDVAPLGGTCGRSNVDALCLQAPPVVDLYAMYMAVKIDRSIAGVLRSVRGSDMCACREHSDRAEDCIVEDRRFPCVVHRVTARPKAPMTLLDMLAAMSAIASRYLCQ
jgi:hypothetical protein